jgi:hypothetical protein
MLKMLKIRWLVPASLLLLVVVSAAPLGATALDATLFTTYTINSAHTDINWSVCGSTAGSSGCYGSGGIGPFGKAGAILEGNPSTNVTKGTVTRSIYVLDVGYGTSGDGVALYIYKKVDTITSSFDTVVVTLSKTVALPLTGGSSALASMAANTGFLFIGTNQSSQGVRVQKSNSAIVTIPGFSPPINVAAITSDKYGYVTVTFGSFNGGESGFYVYGPNGTLQEDGGGAPFMANTMQAVLPSTLP